LDDTRFPFSREEIEQSIPDRFERVVLGVPDQLAVKSSADSCTYLALNERANQIARAIVDAYGEGGASVALLLEPGIALIAAMLGVLKAGLAYVVLDPSLPLSRLLSITEDSLARLLLTDDENLSLAGNLSLGIPTIINLDKINMGLSKENLDLQILPSNPAAIYYTSGSTGKPKGILRNHRDILYRGWIYNGHYNISTDDNVSQVFSFSFAASTSDMFGTLLNGAVLCIFNIRKSTLRQIVDWLDKEGITVFHSPVAFFRQLIYFLTGEEKFPKLRMIQLGGAPLFKKDVERSRLILSPTCTLNNRFATTEVGLIASFMIEHDTEIVGDNVPVGYPVEGMEVQVLDEKGKGVDPNCVGEIVVRSRFLAPGYWHNPEQTREKFLPATFNNEEPLYLTGDLGRMGLDGLLEHLGRKDTVVKVRGYRVDTIEIESALREHPDIKDVFVTPRPVPHAPEENRVIAYLVPAPGKSATGHTLHDFLYKRLPTYMMPARYIFLDVMPLNSNGKVDTRALPEPSQVTSEPYIPPRDPIEQRLTQIWSKAFNLERIGIKDDFFELGGDSLLAAQMHSEIENWFIRRLPLTFLVENPTIEQMAKYMQASTGNRANHSIVGIQPEGSKPNLFIFPGNSGRVLYYYHRLASLLGDDQPVYGIEMVLTGEQPTPSTWLEETARRYREEIQEFQPSGPYYLAGYSFGGLLVYEIALQMIATGEQVAFVGLLNSHLPSIPPPRKKVSFIERIKIHRNNLRGLNQREQMIYFKARIRILMDRMEHYRPLRTVFRYLALEPKGVSPINSIASRTYQPKFYPGKITLFRALDDSSPKYVERLANWKKIVSELEVFDIPGTHGTIMDEAHVGLLAGRLKQCLAEAQAAVKKSG